MISELNNRSRDIFRLIVDSYLAGGDPIGSRTIAQKLEHHSGMSLSAATIRNVMADLEDSGLLYAPHISAGRLPTLQGLRLYIDGLMEIGNLAEADRRQIENECVTSGHSMPQMMARAGTLLAGLSSGAGIVITQKTEKPIKQIQFIKLDSERILIVLVMQDGMIENRVMNVTNDIPASALNMASNYLNDRLASGTIDDVRAQILEEIQNNKTTLSEIETSLVKQGLAVPPDYAPNGHIIIRGQSSLLQDVKAIEDLERARGLFAALEEQETIARLLDATQTADGIQIFIGTESQTFQHAGWSMVMSPYRGSEGQLVGAIGVIGPTRLNYGRIIPIVDYTTKIMEKIMRGAVSSGHL